MITYFYTKERQQILKALSSIDQFVVRVIDDESAAGHEAPMECVMLEQVGEVCLRQSLFLLHTSITTANEHASSKNETDCITLVTTITMVAPSYSHQMESTKLPNEYVCSWHI